MFLYLLWWYHCTEGWRTAVLSGALVIVGIHNVVTMTMFVCTKNEVGGVRSLFIYESHKRLCVTIIPTNQISRWVSFICSIYHLGLHTTRSVYFLISASVVTFIPFRFQPEVYRRPEVSQSVVGFFVCVSFMHFFIIWFLFCWCIIALTSNMWLQGPNLA